MHHAIPVPPTFLSQPRPPLSSHTTSSTGPYHCWFHSFLLCTQQASDLFPVQCCASQQFTLPRHNPSPEDEALPHKHALALAGVAQSHRVVQVILASSKGNTAARDHPRHQRLTQALDKLTKHLWQQQAAARAAAMGGGHVKQQLMMAYKTEMVLKQASRQAGMQLVQAKEGTGRLWTAHEVQFIYHLYIGVVP